MAIFHCHMKAISRGKGRSATAAAAYRAGVCLQDERTGEVHDYTRKQGVEHSEIITPDGSLIERTELWNLAEAVEKRKDSRTAREYELALPSELPPKERQELALAFGRKIVEQFGVAADVCIHAPTEMGDQRNHHAHILTTTRKFEQGKLTEKAHPELENKALKNAGLKNTKVILEELRGLWAHMVNCALERAGHSARVDARSLEAQGIHRAPTHHLGPTVTEMERQGIQTERGALNRVSADLGLQAERQELASLERQQQGIHAARQRLHVEMVTRAAEKAAAEERERQRKQQEAESVRKRQAERAELEKQYGQAVCMLVCPRSLPAARSYAEYGRYLDRLQAATPEQRAEMVKELQHAEQRYGAQELFYSLAELVSRDTSISGRQKVRDTMLKEWDRATPERREQMELKAREAIRTYARERSCGMSMGRN